MPTRAEIEAARTPAGGWTRETLAGWGVSWPPKSGWKARLEAEAGERPAVRPRARRQIGRRPCRATAPLFPDD